MIRRISQHSHRAFVSNVTPGETLAFVALTKAALVRTENQLPVRTWAATPLICNAPCPALDTRQFLTQQVPAAGRRLAGCSRCLSACSSSAAESHG